MGVENIDEGQDIENTDREQRGASPPAAGGQQEKPSSLPPIPSCYRERDDLPDAKYRLLHSLDAAHGGVAVTSVRFDRSGRRLASGGADGTAAIWDPDTGALLYRLEGHTAGISDVAWSPDGRHLATASDDTTLRVWDAASGACVRLLKGHTHWVSCCAFSSGGNLLVSGGFDEAVLVWDVRHARPVKRIPGHCDPVTGVAFSGEPGLRERIASCSFDGLTRVWDAQTGRCQATLTDTANASPAVAAVRFTPNGQYLLTTTLDGRLLLWDPVDRKVKRKFRGHANAHSCCQATFVVHSSEPRQYCVACGSEDHHVYLWSLQSRQIVGILRGRASADTPGDGHSSVVLSVDAAMERPLLASAGHYGDGAIKIWADEGWESPAAPAAAVHGAADAAAAPMDMS